MASLIVCPPPEPRPAMTDKARAAADYVIDMHRRGLVGDEDLAASRLVRRRLAELEATGHPTVTVMEPVR